MKLKQITTAFIPLILAFGCYASQRASQSNDKTLNSEETAAAVKELRAAYAAFNRGDIEAATRFLDPQVEWIEPPDFPGGGTYRGVDAVKEYLRQSRAGATEVTSTPERFLTAGNRIVVFVHARVLPKDTDTWQDVQIADVYTIQGGRATSMHAFADRDDALHWAGVEEGPK